MYLKEKTIRVFGGVLYFTKPKIFVRQLTIGEMIYFLESFTNQNNVFEWPILPSPAMGERFMLITKAQHDMVKRFVLANGIDLNKMNINLLYSRMMYDDLVAY